MRHKQVNGHTPAATPEKASRQNWVHNVPHHLHPVAAFELCVRDGGFLFGQKVANDKDPGVNVKRLHLSRLRLGVKLAGVPVLVRLLPLGDHGVVEAGDQERLLPVGLRNRRRVKCPNPKL